MNIQLINKINKEIAQSSKIIILRHQKPDFDAIGSQVGLGNILKDMYPQKEIKLYGSDNIREFSFIGENEDLLKKDFDNALIIILDTANIGRLEGDFNYFKAENLKIIKIDHHPDVEPYGDINIVDTEISSTSELIYKVFIEKLQYKLSKNSAKALYIGIYGDTGGFVFSNTKAETFRVLSKLVAENFEYEKLLLKLRERDFEIVKVLGWMYQNIQIEDGVGILLLDNDTLKKLRIKRNRISALVNEFGIIKEIKAWVLMIEYIDFIRVNLRSKGDINVSEIAMQYNGGGHKNASGATIKSWNEKDKIIKDLKNSVKRNR